MLSEREKWLMNQAFEFGGLNKEIPTFTNKEAWIDTVADYNTGETFGDLLDIKADEVTNEFTGTVTREPVK